VLLHVLYRPAEIRRFARALRPDLIIVAAAVAWTAVAAAASTNHVISTGSLAWVAAAAVVFVAVTLAAASWSTFALGVLIIAPAAINSFIAVLQRLELWSPVVFSIALPLRVRVTALVGNPDDVGSYLLAPLLFATAAALTARGGRRIGLIGLALLLLAAMFATASVSAVLAAGVAVIVMLSLTRRRYARQIAVAAMVLFPLVFLIVPPMRHRGATLLIAARNSDVSGLTAGRTAAFYAAWQLFTDHPINGAGPGTFRWWYMPYKLKVNRAHPELTDAQLANFEQVHNDHLELLAAAGIPAYALFLTALARLGSTSFVRDDPDEATVARLLPLPLAIAVFVLTLGQFPLELAAPLLALLQTAAFCVASRAR
jgi:O-antigen ligase